MVRLALIAVAAAALLSACGSKSPVTTTKPATNQQIFQVKGVVVGLEPDGKTATIKHEEIPGYMGAMTMPFEVKNTNELSDLMPGDIVSFRMVVTDTDGWIEQVTRLNSSRTNVLPATGPVRAASDVEPLAEGDMLPEYNFINQDGQRFSTAQFKGKTLAITFLFTRCPFPTLCPAMADNFSAAQKKLLSLRGSSTNWHLLTISFDPEFDKPAVLKSYAIGHGHDLKYSTFATGELIDITSISQQLGLTFWRDETGSISHNLRTVIVSPTGRIEKIYVGNQWTSDELVEEMLKAAGKE